MSYTMAGTVKVRTKDLESRILSPWNRNPCSLCVLCHHARWSIQSHGEVPQDLRMLHLRNDTHVTLETGFRPQECRLVLCGPKVNLLHGLQLRSSADCQTGVKLAPGLHSPPKPTQYVPSAFLHCLMATLFTC